MLNHLVFFFPKPSEKRIHLTYKNLLTDWLTYIIVCTCSQTLDLCGLVTQCSEKKNERILKLGLGPKNFTYFYTVFSWHHYIKNYQVGLHLFCFGKKENKVIEHNGLIIDPEKYLVTYDGKEHMLAKKEFELLHLLASKPGRVFLRNEILSQVWGNDVIVGDRTIDVHIRKIRQKLGLDCITTVKGVGYKFEL